MCSAEPGGSHGPHAGHGGETAAGPSGGRSLPAAEATKKVWWAKVLRSAQQSLGMLPRQTRTDKGDKMNTQTSMLPQSGQQPCRSPWNPLRLHSELLCLGVAWVSPSQCRHSVFSSIIHRRQREQRENKDPYEKTARGPGAEGER